MFLLNVGNGIYGNGKYRLANPDAAGQGREIELTADRVAPVNGGPIRTVACRKGTVWLTQEGDYQDHLLHAGEVLLVVNRKRVIAQALEDARIEITPMA